MDKFELLRELNPEALLADGFEDAYVGFLERCTAHDPVACYDYDKCVIILMKRDGMSRIDATEFMEFNVVGAWVGEFTPFFLHPCYHTV